MGQARNAPTALSADFSAVQGKQHLSQPGLQDQAKGVAAGPTAMRQGAKLLPLLPSQMQTFHPDEAGCLSFTVLAMGAV